MTLTYFDARFGDTYTIDLDAEGEFRHALRHVGHVGRDPIVYDNLNGVPQPHRNAIEHLIWQSQQPKPIPQS